MSDTPLTDNLRSKLYPYSWESSYWQMKSHAESLERQLAESRDTVRKMEMAIQHHERQIAEVTKQRDELAARIGWESAIATLKGDKP